MSARPSTARRWTCGRCAVSVSRIDGAEGTLPESWSSTADECFCLSCRREQAAEAALEAAPADCSSDVKSKLRRAGMVEFEVRRAPDRPDNAIAKACRTSASAVVKARGVVGRR